MFHSINYCRAVAAFLVLFFHASANLAKDKYFGDNANFIENFFWFGGNAGVAFFFVLSGFIISHVHDRDIDCPDRIYQYIKKRCIRVYPPYVIIFLVVYVSAKFVPSLSATVPYNLYIIAKALLLIPMDKEMIGGTGAPIIVVAWSLQYEIMFYALFGVAIIRKKAVYYIATLYLICLFFTYHCDSKLFPINFFGSHYVAIFSMGIITSFLIKKIEYKNIQIITLLVAIIIFFVVAIFATINRYNNNLVIFDMMYGVASSILIFVLVMYEKNNFQFHDLLGVSKYNIIGNMSYSMYLVHFPLVAVFSKIAIIIFANNSSGVVGALFLLIFGSFFGALLFHLIIEKPVVTFLNSKLIKTK